MEKNQNGIDMLLHVHERTFRTMPGKLLFGPTGRRLCVDYLDPLPGFSGRIDVIHKTNIPLVFSVRPAGKHFEGRKRSRSDWYPSHLHMCLDYAGLHLDEDKFLTETDILISVQHWENETEEDAVLELVLPEQSERAEDGWIYCPGPLPHGIQAGFWIGGEEEFRSGKYLRISAGESRTLTVAACLWDREREDAQMARALVQEWFRIPAEDRLGYQKNQYSAWFDDVPVFDSDDSVLNRTWWYRWFLLRHNYCRPDTGFLRHGYFSEGRSHKASKTPYSFQGHEFTQLIPLSTPMHLMDARWKRHGEECEETVRSLLDSMDEQGYFSLTAIDRHGTHYGNFAQWAVYAYFLIHPSVELVRSILPDMKRSFYAVVAGQRTEKDILPVCYDHRRTGKEYQPSFWYFTGYPETPQDNSTFLPLKRVDLACCLYLNALGLARLCAMAGDEEESRFYETAQEMKRLILDKMWDEEDQFFYDLHFMTEERAKVRCITGFDPFAAGLTDEQHIRALDSLLSAEGFSTGDAFASVSRDAPVYEPQGGWKGHFFKGRNGCVWDGPSWPFTTSVALDALAKQSKRFGHRWDGAFAERFGQYILEHYQGHDTKRPYLVEHYDCETGEALSDEPDYLHSYFIDLVMRHIVGLEIDETGVRLDPMDVGLKRFSLEGAFAAGHMVDVFWDARDGYRMLIDGKERYRGPMPRGAYIPWEEKTVQHF